MLYTPIEIMNGQGRTMVFSPIGIGLGAGLPSGYIGGPPAGFDIENDKHVAKTGNDTTGDGSWELPYLTIQKGVDEVADTYQVWVNVGTYQENVIHNTAKSLKMKSVSDDYDTTIIDANASGAGLAISNGGAGAQTLDGLAFINASAAGLSVATPGAGGLAFTNCRWEDNADNSGAGISLSPGAGITVTITTSLFKNNVASTGNGGAIYHSNGHLVMDQCTFTENRAGIGSGDNGSCIYHAGVNSVTLTNILAYENAEVEPLGQTYQAAFYCNSCAGDYLATDVLGYDNRNEWYGLFAFDTMSGTTTLNHITAVDNSQDQGTGAVGAAVSVLSAAAVELKNSIGYMNLDKDNNVDDLKGTNLTVNYCFTTDTWAGAGGNNLDEVTSSDVVGFTNYAGDDFTINPVTSDCFEAADDGDDMGSRYFTKLT